MNSPVKNTQQQKCKDAPTQVYKPVVMTTLLLTGGGTETGVDGNILAKTDIASISHEEGKEFVKEAKKNKPTPENSAETAARSCQSQ